MERPKIIHGHRVGLMIGRTECFALGIALRRSDAPNLAAELRAKARVIIDYWSSKGTEPLYEIDDKVLNLGLRRLGKFGIAVRENRRWRLTEQGQAAVDEAATPFVSP